MHSLQQLAGVAKQIWLSQNPHRLPIYPLTLAPHCTERSGYSAGVPANPHEFSKQLAKISEDIVPAGY
jgi:hypothetical protein